MKLKIQLQVILRRRAQIKAQAEASKFAVGSQVRVLFDAYRRSRYFTELTAWEPADDPPLRENLEGEVACVVEIFPVFDIALELMACPIVAWSKVFPDMPMTWSIHSREDDEEGPAIIYMQLHLSTDTAALHKARLPAWVYAKDDEWTLAESVPGTSGAYVASITTLNAALACLVDGSHGT